MIYFLFRFTQKCADAGSEQSAALKTKEASGVTYAKKRRKNFTLHA